MNIKFFIIHKSPPYVILAISVIFFGSAHIVLSQDSKFVACAPVSCGQGPNISYPFWISNLQESYCGHPNFEIFCSDAYPILSISDDNYVIKNISFNNNSIHLVNSMLYDYENTCPIPLHNFSLSNTPFDYSPGYANLYFLYNCSSYPSYPTYKIDCGGNSSRVSFAVFHPDILKHYNYSISSCQPCVNALVEDEDIDTILNSNFTDTLRNGFALEWNETNCSSCKGSGGRCGWDKNGFTCFCPDRPHPRTCNDGIYIGVC